MWNTKGTDVPDIGGRGTTQPPDPTVTITGVDSPAVAGDPGTVRGTASGGTITAVSVALDAAPGAGSTNATPVGGSLSSWTAIVTYPAAGSHTIQAVARNSSKSSSVATFALTTIADLGFSILSPQDGDTISSGPVQMQVNCPDQNSKIECSLDVLPSTWTPLTASGPVWCLTLAIPSTGLQAGQPVQHTIAVHEVRAGGAATAPVTVTLNAVDSTPPLLRVDEPQDQLDIRSQLVESVGQVADITLQGHAEDGTSNSALVSGLQRVEVSRDGGANWVKVALDASEDWSYTFSNQPPGAYQIAARAFDNFGNMTRVDRDVTIRDAGALTDISPNAYLRDLIDYSCSRVQRPGGGLITPGTLDGVFHQPFSALANPDTSDPGTPVSAIRLTCTTLRDFITPADPPMLAHWPLTGATTTELTRDIAGDPPQNLTIAGGVQPLADTERHQQVADFDGTGVMSIDPRYASRQAKDPLYPLGSFTVTAWVRPTALPQVFAGLICRGPNYQYGIRSDGTVGSTLASMSYKIPLNTWTHLAFVYDFRPDAQIGKDKLPGGDVLLYVNGSLVPDGTQKDVTGPLVDADYADHPVMLGVGMGQLNIKRTKDGPVKAESSGDGYKGQLSDVRIHAYALAPAEVARLANKLFTKPLLLGDAPTPGVEVDNPQGWTWQPDSTTPGGNRLSTPATPSPSTYTVREPVLPWPLVSRGEALSAWVRTDPTTPPSALSISWRDESGDDPTDWHTATWSADSSATGPLPPAGRWAQLSVGVNQIGMAGRMLTGLRLSVTGGAGTSWALLTKDDWRTAGAGPIRDYLVAAYESLLASVGTSFTEVRLTRSHPDTQARQALADRLGIDLTDPDKTGTRPDRLDLLLLTPDAGTANARQPLTEDKLATLFGLPLLLAPQDAATTPPTGPDLLTWRRDRLHAQWLAADSAAPVLDPDIVTADDLLNPVDGDPAYDLWRARRSWLDDQYLDLQTRLLATADSTDLTATITQSVDGQDLIDLDNQRLTGHDITDTLNTHDLDLPGFTQLVQVLRLAEVPDVEILPEEITDVAAILTTHFKHSLGYPTWLAEEADFAITHKGPMLSPAWFTVPTADTPSPIPPEWRGTARDRQIWDRTLQARAQQENTVTAQLQNAYLAADEASLPVLRDFLISAAAPTNDPGASERQLGQRLLIDMGPTGQSTKTQRAIETLQSLLAAVRAEGFDAPVLESEFGPTPTGWSLDVPADPSFTAAPPGPELFDLEWAWIGAYSAWTSVQWVFLYPDAVLLPSLQRSASDAFTTLVADLRAASPVSAADAIRIAEKYRSALVIHGGQAPIITVGWLAPGGDLAALRQLSQTWFPPGTSRNLWAEAASAAGLKDPDLTRLEVLYHAPMQIGRALHQAGDFAAALDWYRRVYTLTEPPDRRAVGNWLAQPDTSSFSHSDTWLQVNLDPHALAATRHQAHLRYTTTSIAQCLLDFADSEFAAATTAESLPQARLLYLDTLDTLDQLDAAADPTPGAPPDITGALLRRRAEINLAKLRNGRDIAGVLRPTDTQTSPAPPAFSSNGALQPPTPITQPGPYRYSTLITRAQQLTATAGQLEAAYLAALKDHDTAGYTAARAQQDLSVANAMLTVHNDQVAEAQDNTQLANDQLTRAQTQYNTYDTWLAQGPNAYEQDQLASIETTADLQNQLADLDTMSQVMQTAFSVAASSEESFGATAALAVPMTVAAFTKGSLTKQLSAIQAQAQSDALVASWQRRADEWTLARALASADTTLAKDQQKIAADRVTDSQDELAVATQQQVNVQATVNYLATQFTSAELFEWMSQVLGQSYRFLLQQATATAQQAQSALIFERQDPSIQYIRADYWSAPPPDDATQPVASSSQPDRKGLTGSARLQADLTALDQYAFTTDRRRLQMTQAISLAQASPVDFQRFRDTGVLPFTTTNAWFDRAFPGHYMRTIDTVRVTVVGLIPTLTGIRATLTASGLSRIVTGGDTFSTAVIRRNPETIAFTSPSNATGLAFELDPQAQLLKPFEGMGIESNWELRMPKAANPLDYTQLADVIISFDYTALDSDDYRTQILHTLDTVTQAQITLSLARDLPDTFYSFVNTGPTNPLTAVFPVDASYLPPNLTPSQLQAVAVYFVTTPEFTDEIDISALIYTNSDKTKSGGAAQTQSRIASTNGSAAAWVDTLVGAYSPVGNWTLTLQDSPGIRTALTTGGVTDIVLALSYAATLPPWPV